MDKLETGPPSNKIIDSIKKRNPIDYSNLRTISDVFMLQLGWIFEVKHQTLLKLIIKENLILDIFDYLKLYGNYNFLREEIDNYIVCERGVVLS